MNALTIFDIQNLTEPTLTVAQVSEVLGMDPATIRWQAREEPAALGFPVIVAKSRTYIPRLPFIQYMTRLEVKHDP